MAEVLGIALLPDELPYLIAELAQMQALARRLQERLDDTDEPGLQPAATP